MKNANKRGIVRRLALGGLATAALAVAGAGTSYYAATKTNLFDGSMPVPLCQESERTAYAEGDNVHLQPAISPRIEAKILDVPVYNSLKLGDGSCSGYVRLAAEELFGANYSKTDAWNRRYRDEVVAEVGNRTLESFVAEGVLRPGMIVGVYFPKSNHNKDIDETGTQVRYTHNMLYLGENENSEPVFAEKFGNTTRTRTESEFAEHNLLPIEILQPRTNPSTQTH